jgi:hypothetical protein
MENKLDQRSA